MDFNPMKIAVEEARIGVNLFHGGPFGAVIIYQEKVIGRGHNRVIASNDPTAHAEIEAIRDACARQGTHNLSGAVLYTTCYPCPMCLGAILWARITKVYYCISSDEVAKIGFDDDNFFKIINDKSYLADILVAEDAEKKSCIDLLEYYSNMQYQMY